MPGQRSQPGHNCDGVMTVRLVQLSPISPRPGDTAMKSSQRDWEAPTAALGRRKGIGDPTRRYRLSRGVAVLVAAAALGLAACGGGSSSPKVASLPSSTSSRKSDGPTGGGDPATQPTGNPTKLLGKWTACMRSHGDP